MNAAAALVTIVEDGLSNRIAHNAYRQRYWRARAIGKLERRGAPKQTCYLCQDLGLPEHVKGEITHIAEPKEESKVLVAPHRLRDTYTSALAEIKTLPYRRM